MTDYDRYLVDIAVSVLKEMAHAPGKDQKPTHGVRLALRVLLPHCPERWPLTQYWEGINGTHEIGRSQTTGAAFNGIILQLKKSGAWAEDQQLRLRRDQP
jgi:hypothetical protein